MLMVDWKPVVWADGERVSGSTTVSGFLEKLLHRLGVFMEYVHTYIHTLTST